MLRKKQDAETETDEQHETALQSKKNIDENYNVKPENQLFDVQYKITLVESYEIQTVLQLNEGHYKVVSDEERNDYTNTSTTQAKQKGKNGYAFS